MTVREFFIRMAIITAVMVLLIAFVVCDRNTKGYDPFPTVVPLRIGPNP